MRNKGVHVSNFFYSTLVLPSLSLAGADKPLKLVSRFNSSSYGTFNQVAGKDNAVEQFARYVLRECCEGITNWLLCCLRQLSDSFLNLTLRRRVFAKPHIVAVATNKGSYSLNIALVKDDKVLSKFTFFSQIQLVVDQPFFCVCYCFSRSFAWVGVEISFGFCQRSFQFIVNFGSSCNFWLQRVPSVGVKVIDALNTQRLKQHGGCFLVATAVFNCVYYLRVIHKIPVLEQLL